MSEKSIMYGVFVTIFFAAVLVCVAVVSALSYNTSIQNVHIIVKDKDRALSENNTSYRIYTENETFVVEDSLFHWTFDSADRYGRLNRGGKYSCKAVGWRVPALSTFRNLVSCESR